MTPGDKVIQLVNSFEERIEARCNQSSREAHYEAAKQCALIAVNEILKATMDDNPIRDLNGEWSNEFACSPYWQQVKEEIEKL